ncbi:MAG TPA: DNA mismatch repair protein MutT, partial [Algoriphagus sp.]|nr:DNA mismatch repair protein MutT [Algoriphagus sp.]
MEHNPWKTLKIKPIYNNPWIRLEEHDVLNPAGKEGIYGKVHFKNKAMGIIPVDKNGNTWLVGQYRYTLKEYSWEIPMG